jgi:hypothetical protein
VYKFIWIRTCIWQQSWRWNNLQIWLRSSDISYRRFCVYFDQIKTSHSSSRTTLTWQFTCCWGNTASQRSTGNYQVNLVELKFLSVTFVIVTSNYTWMNNFFRDHRTKRDDFVFYSKRLMRIVIEYALSFLPFEVKHFSFIFGKNAARSIMECTFLLFSSSTSQFLFILLQDYELTTKGGSTYRGKRYAGQGVSMKYRCFSPLSTFG